MLPDFPEQKDRLGKLLMLRFEATRNAHMVPFDSISHHAHHEGSSWLLKRQDGSNQAAGYVSSSVDIQIDPAEIEQLNLEIVLQKLDQAAEQLALGMSKSMIDTIFKVTEEAGQVVDAGGQGLTQQHFLSIFDRLEIEFDKTGAPLMPQLVVNPETAPAVLEAFKAWEDDIEFKRKWSDLIQRKREDWHDREGHRKLVD